MNINNILKNVQIKIRPVNEFKYFIIGYLKREEISSLTKELNLQVDEKVLEIYKYIDENQSEFLKKEIEFFSIGWTLGVSTKAFIDDFNEIETFGDYLKKFDESTDEELFNFIGGSFLWEYYKGENNKWSDVKHSMPLMTEYIRNINFQTKFKKHIVSIFDSPQETKMRLRYVLTSLYNFYKNFEEELLSKVLEETNSLQKLLEEDTENFCNRYFSDTFADPEKDKIEIYCSYMYMFGNEMYKNRSTNIPMLFLGCRNDEYIKEKKSNANLDKFLKLISDKTRQKILFLLSGEERFTQSLAKELDLTAATISYHLQNFLLNELVIVRQKDNDIRAYYSLNKKKVNEYLELIRKRLNLGQD